MKFPGLELEPMEDSSGRRRENLFNVRLPDFFKSDGRTYVPGTAPHASEWELSKIIYISSIDKFLLFAYNKSKEEEPKLGDDSLSILGKDYENVKSFINYYKLYKVLPDPATDLLWTQINKRDAPPWNEILFQLQKEIKLTEQDCVYLGIDPTRAERLKKSSDLGLI